MLVAVDRASTTKLEFASNCFTSTPDITFENMRPSTALSSAGELSPLFVHVAGGSSLSQRSNISNVLSPSVLFQPVVHPGCDNTTPISSTSGQISTVFGIDEGDGDGISWTKFFHSAASNHILWPPKTWYRSVVETTPLFPRSKFPVLFECCARASKSVCRAFHPCAICFRKSSMIARLLRAYLCVMRMFWGKC